MKTYRVIWEVDVEAEDPPAAARQALAIQRRTGSSATVFDVVAHDQPGRKITVDLLLDRPHQQPPNTHRHP